jgi:NAD-dependent dihydropyrimidine dehydrogenase PreA subunit
MTKILKATYSERCTGCEMCVIEVQHQLKKLGLEGSLIRIFRRKDKSNKEGVIFSIDIDPRVNNLDIERIKSVCPQGVFSIEDA